VIAIGVGGLEAENVMLGRASWMRLPDIIGVELRASAAGITATDVVLALTEFLRKQKWSVPIWNFTALALLR
jgi:aconitate hydratase